MRGPRLGIGVQIFNVVLRNTHNYFRCPLRAPTILPSSVAADDEGVNCGARHLRFHT